MYNKISNLCNTGFFISYHTVIIYNQKFIGTIFLKKYSNCKFLITFVKSTFNCKLKIHNNFFLKRSRFENLILSITCILVF